MKRLISMMIIISIALSSFSVGTAYAEGKLLADYDMVRITTAITDWSDLEGAFRLYVKEVADDYFQNYTDKSRDEIKYYYEAADLKNEFDSLWWNADLKYNTNANDDKTDYQKETREIILYMLAQNIQQKVKEMKNLSPQEAAKFYPGIEFDVTTGEWTVNDQPVLQQEIYNNKVSRAIEQGLNEASILFAETLVDTGEGLYGVVNSKGEKAISIILSAVKNARSQCIDLVYDQAEKELENAYREVMIADLVQAQRNIDEQMLQGLMSIRVGLKNKENSGKLTEDEKMLLREINEIIAICLVNKTEDDILGQEYNGKNIEKYIDDLCGKEQIVLSDKELEVRQTMIVVKEVLRAGCKMILEATDTEALKSENILADVGKKGSAEVVIDTIVDSVFLNLSDIGFESVDANNDGNLSNEEYADYISTHFSIEKILIMINSCVEKYVQKYADRQASASFKDMHEQLISEKTVYYNTPKPDEFVPSSTLRTKMDNYEKWNEFKNDWGFIVSLIENGVEYIKVSKEGFKTIFELDDMIDNEVYYSYISSAMYRAKQLAEEGRRQIRNKYQAYSKGVNNPIETADIKELKDFVEKVYAVLNTDMIGQAYYVTLARGYFRAENISYYDNLDAFRDELSKSKAYIDADGSFFEKIGWYSGVTITSPLLLVEMELGAFMVTGMDQSEYLSFVDGNSKINSWISVDDGIEIYNIIANSARKAEIPSYFDELFANT